jgi:hypothetical protein
MSTGVQSPRLRVGCLGPHRCRGLQESSEKAVSAVAHFPASSGATTEAEVRSCARPTWETESSSVKSVESAAELFLSIYLSR